MYGYGNEEIKESIVNRLLTMVDKTKKDLKMSGWIHMPKGSEEYEYYKALCVQYEAFAHTRLGGMLLTEEDKNVPIGHYKKARAIYNLVGMKHEAKHMDTTILMLTSNRQATNQQSLSPSPAAMRSMLQCMKNAYEQYINTQGMNSDTTIHTGLRYSNELHDTGCHLEAEQIVAKLATVSRQVHGPEHKTTIKADKLLKKCKQRLVSVFPDAKKFQALRYENDGEICVVQGPITEPRDIEVKRTYRVKSHLVYPGIGCPVICHGLVSASQLNGELGEVRGVKESETGIRLAVHFKKKKSALVKPENLRITFELPDEME
jgi:hypothetical protein